MDLNKLFKGIYPIYYNLNVYFHVVIWVIAFFKGFLFLIESIHIRLISNSFIVIDIGLVE
jgi:preprotein translocase subunit SecE